MSLACGCAIAVGVGTVLPQGFIQSIRRNHVGKPEWFTPYQRLETGCFRHAEPRDAT